MTTWADPPVLPSYTLPEALEIPAPVLELPQAEIPSYTPIVVPPNTLRPPPGVEGIPLPEKPPEPAGRKKRKKKNLKRNAKVGRKPDTSTNTDEPSVRSTDSQCSIYGCRDTYANDGNNDSSSNYKCY